MRPLLCLLAVSLLALAGGPEQERAPRRMSIRVPVWSESPDPLDAKEFRSLLNGKQTPIRRARGPQDDMVILLAMDLTGDLSLVETARKALDPLVESLPATVWVGVLKAHDNLQVLVDPAPDRAE